MVTSATSRIFLLAFTVLIVAPVTALAQAYPTKPIRFIAPFPPGAPERVTELVKTGSVRMGQLVKAAGIQPE